MNSSIMRRPFLFLSRLLAAIGFLCVPALAQITGTIQSVSSHSGSPNAPHFVIDSDSLNDNPLFSRDKISATISASFTRPFSLSAASGVYRVTAQLIGPDGNPVTLAGGGTTAFGPNTTVEMAPAVMNLPVNFPISLDPDVDLGAGSAYHIRTRLQSGALFWNGTFFTYNFTNIDGPEDSTSFTTVHFTDLPEVAANRNVRGYLRGTPTWTKTFAHRNGANATQKRFSATVPYTLARYDLGGETAAITVRFTAILTDDSGNSVPLEGGGVNTISYTRNASNPGLPNVPHSVNGTFTLHAVPIGQLDSRNRTYRLSVRFEHLEALPSTYYNNGTSPETPLERLLHFNGTLRFGPLATSFTNITNTPEPGALGAGFVGTLLNTEIGTIPGFPSYTVGAGADLAVQLQSSGDAVLSVGSRTVVVAGGGPVTATYGGVVVSYPVVTLGTSGPVASSTVVNLPQGLGYTPGRAGSGGRYQRLLTLPGRTLQVNFRHSGTLTQATPADAWVFDEARPLLYRVSQFSMPQSGVINFVSDNAEYVHLAANNQLQAQQSGGVHESSTMSYRLSNDGHLHFARSPGSQTLAFTAAADGSVRTASADLEVIPGAFRTHFPIKSFCKWSATGTIKLRDGIIAEDSALPDAEKIDVAYDGSCSEDDCAPPPGTADAVVTVFPENQTLLYTPDGGLYAPGAVDSHPIKWGIRGDGTAAHRTDEFSKAHFLAPGSQLYQTQNPNTSGPLAAQSADLSPASLLLAAHDPADHKNTVYFNSQRYSQGIGIYAGATMTVTDGGFVGASLLADMEDDYPYILQPDVSKYYVRPSGLSGRHVAEEDSFSGEAKLYEYNFKISRFQLTFLSNTNEESWVNGEVNIPFPSQFSQRFLELKLTCTGALASAEIDPADAGTKPLAYWNGSFKPLAMRFAPKEGGSCYGDRALTLGIISGAANIPTPLSGSLAFLDDGNIGSIADGIEGVDSRLGLPPSISLAGPGDEKYHLTPASKLYFNNHASPGRPDTGYVGFASRCAVPFFEDLKVHCMTSAQANIEADIFLTSGWSEGGQTHFTHAEFDASHRGFPNGYPVADYRNAATDQYVPRAKQSIFGVINLDYPLKWAPTGRYFTSWAPLTNDLFVLNTEHQVDYLSAENAEITFGVQYDGLPQINLVSTAIDLADEQIGAAHALSQAATTFVTDTLNQGVDELGNLVSDSLETVLDEALDAMEDEVIDPLYGAVVASYNQAVSNNLTYNQWVNNSASGLTAQFDRYLDGSVGVGADSIKGRLEQLHTAASETANLLKRVEDALERGILAIDSVTGKIERVGGEIVFNPTIPTGTGEDIINGILAEVEGDGGTLERQIVQSLVGQLIHALAPSELAGLLTSVTGELTASINEELNAILAEFDPTLDRITEALLQARGYLDDVRKQIVNGGAIVTSFTQIIEGAEDDIDMIVDSIRSTGHTFINQIAASATYLPNTILGSAGNLINEFDKEEFVNLIRAELRDRLLAAPFIQQIQFALRQYISEIEITIRSAIDSAFAEVSRMCKSLIKEALGPIDDAINELIGDVNSYVGAGSLDGYAHIEGDTLRRLRIDARVQLKVPDEMELHAYFEMLCFDSSSDVGSSACLEPGEEVVEVKIGAMDVPLDWISPDLRANLEVRFSMKTAPSVLPNGIGGSLEMTGGELDFQSLKITAFAASVAVGADECYLAATARVIVSGYEAAGGLFFGRTCSLAPLELVDPDVASLLGTPPFTGAYVYGEVWIPISEVLLGIPSSCFFRISAGVGAGAFFFVEGPTFGGRMLLGVSGEALCVVSIRGEVSMTGVMNGGSLRFRGRGTLTGKAGWCPFCVKFRESATITYQGGSWDIDY